MSNKKLPELFRERMVKKHGNEFVGSVYIPNNRYVEPGKHVVTWLTCLLFTTGVTTAIAGMDVIASVTLVATTFSSIINFFLWMNILGYTHTCYESGEVASSNSSYADTLMDYIDKGIPISQIDNAIDQARAKQEKEKRYWETKNKKRKSAVQRNRAQALIDMTASTSVDDLILQLQADEEVNALEDKKTSILHPAFNVKNSESQQG